MNPQNANTAQMISPEAPVSESTSLKRTILVIIVIGILLLLVGVTTLFFIAKNKTSPSMVKNQSQNSAISYPTSSPTTSINPSAISLSQTGSPRNVTALPLGDKKYVTDKPKKGYIYLCRLQSGQGGGAERVGPWIKGSIWDKSVKPHISGTITWPDAFFKNVISSSQRTLSGNSLPVGGSTGIFPVKTTDAAYQYDKNPNTISAREYTEQFPLAPVYSNSPYCMGGEVGVMTNGVSLFNGFDAEYRDAAANEVQDSCDGHPEKTGQYHYHSLSSCFKDIAVSTVIGYALDGYPITGPTLPNGNYLKTADLDECHGMTSEIIRDGKKIESYHYVMTDDFPYSVSCFRAKPVQLQIIKQMAQPQNTMDSEQQSGSQLTGGQRTPPPEAFTACSGKSDGTSCSITTPQGAMQGTCRIPPNQTSLVCVPQ